MSIETKIASLHVSLPKGQRDFVEGEAARTGCTTASEYVRGLIRDAQRARAQEMLEQKLLAGLNSGPATAMTKEDWAQLRAAVRKRAAKKKNGKSS